MLCRFHVPLYCVLLALALALLFPLPVFADDVATPETGSTLGTDLSDAYDQYAGGVDSGLADVKENYNGTVSDSVLGFVQAFAEVFPSEVWVVVGLSIASMVVIGILNWIRG